jgi:endoglucanase
MQATEVTIYGKETISGVIASTPPHLKSAEDEKKLKNIDELIVDTGYSKEEISEIVRVGTPVGFAPIYHELGKDTGRIAGKSFDDKACAAAAIYALCNTPREKLAANVCLLLSAHEETVRIGGVAPAAFAVKPDYAMVIDVNFASVPDTDKGETVPMGKGVSVTMSAVTDKKLTRMVLELCREKEIAHCKCAAASSTGTNSTCLGIVSDGIPLVDIGLPLKNMHTYTELIDLEDCETLAKLVREFVCSKKIAEVYGK